MLSLRMGWGRGASQGRRVIHRTVRGTEVWQLDAHSAIQKGLSDKNLPLIRALFWGQMPLKILLGG